MGKDDATWLNVLYVFMGGIIAFVFYKALMMLSIQYGWEERYDTWLPGVRMVTCVVAGIAGVVFTRMNKERHEYFISSISELRKVTWPTGDETKKMTIVVVVVVIFFAIVLAVFDYIWRNSLNLIL